ncbi:hypothetical protein Sste5346_006084 [Sporothrix stenoceras]|uniref:Uncharacterized protein n=1 Tax=Sporothrix stenoceras TaxID=5173 RepID=A0ABR3Z0B7_9PEZI
MSLAPRMIARLQNLAKRYRIFANLAVKSLGYINYQIVYDSASIRTAQINDAKLYGKMAFKSTKLAHQFRDNAYDSDPDTDSEHNNIYDSTGDYFAERYPYYSPYKAELQENDENHHLEVYVNEVRCAQDWILGINGLGRNAPMYFSINLTYLTERERYQLLWAQHLYKTI